MKKIASLLKSQTLRDTFIISIGLGTTALFGFVYTVLLARVLGPDGFGVYSAVAALATIVYSLGDLGISSALINYLPKNPNRKTHFVNTSFWLQTLVAIISLVLFIFIAAFCKYVIPGSLPSDIMLASALVTNYLFIGFAQGIFTAERRFWPYSASQVIDSGIKISIVFFLFKFNNLSIGTAIAANVFSTFVSLFITFGRELLHIKFEITKTVVKEIFGFAKWIAVSRLFSVFIGRVDIILLNLLSTNYATGIYSAANRVTLLFALMVSGLGSVVNSRFSSFDSHKKVSVYIKKLSLFITGISIAMLVCVALADPIIKIVYGNKYDLAVPVFQWMTLAMIPFLFSLVTTPAIIYTYNMPDFYAKITALQVLLIVVIDILTIPRFSYFAPVIALGLTNILILIITGIKLKILVNEHKTK